MYLESKLPIVEPPPVKPAWDTLEALAEWLETKNPDETYPRRDSAAECQMIALVLIIPVIWVGMAIFASPTIGRFASFNQTVDDEFDGE